MKKYVSYILSSILFIGIVILGFLKAFNHNNIWKSSIINYDILIICLYLLWMLYEIKVSHNDVKQNIIISDYGTRELYGFSHALTILSALWFNSIWSEPGIFHVIGFIVFMIGFLFRIWAIHTLGTHYSHVVRKLDNHQIIDTGPYKFIRHPAYTGMIIAHAGITIFYLNLITLLIFVLLLIPSIVIRIIIEEKTLYSIEGYSKFAKIRNRIIPYVW